MTKPILIARVNKWINDGKIYFEPFNTYILNIIDKRNNFALTNIHDKDKIFQKNTIFVIKNDVLMH